MMISAFPYRRLADLDSLPRTPMKACQTLLAVRAPNHIIRPDLDVHHGTNTRASSTSRACIRCPEFYRRPVDLPGDKSGDHSLKMRLHSVIAFQSAAPPFVDILANLFDPGETFAQSPVLLLFGICEIAKNQRVAGHRYTKSRTQYLPSLFQDPLHRVYAVAGSTVTRRDPIYHLRRCREYCLS